MSSGILFGKRGQRRESDARYVLMKVCVVIPAYDVASMIGEVVKGCLKYVSRVFVVNDGSRDETGKMAAEAGASVITHLENRGKGEALKSGFAEALGCGFDAVVVVDGDGQHDPDELPRFVELARREDADMVLGNRMGDVSNMPFLRRATNFMSSRMISGMLGQEIADSQCGYRLVRARLLRKLELRTHYYDTDSEMIIKAGRLGARIQNLPIRTIYEGEESHIKSFTDTMRFLRVFFRSYFG